MEVLKIKDTSQSRMFSSHQMSITKFVPFWIASIPLQAELTLILILRCTVISSW